MLIFSYFDKFYSLLMISNREVVHEGRVRFLCGLCMAADYNRFAIQKHLDKKHADVEDRARYLVDLVHEWPEYYEMRAKEIQGEHGGLTLCYVDIDLVALLFTRF